MATLQQIADVAGVSPAAVYTALNGLKGSPEKRRRVLAAARELKHPVVQAAPAHQACSACGRPDAALLPSLLCVHCRLIQVRATRWRNRHGKTSTPEDVLKRCGCGELFVPLPDFPQCGACTVARRKHFRQAQGASHV
ncbi:MAG: LacI family DNA-binding transcriptional regulator [Planctomycetes bacterium]|nr:LacI family DNA-binding transcriptional regulator [Planctomycetota bacterium]